MEKPITYSFPTKTSPTRISECRRNSDNSLTLGGTLNIPVVSLILAELYLTISVGADLRRVSLTLTIGLGDRNTYLKSLRQFSHPHLDLRDKFPARTIDPKMLHVLFGPVALTIFVELPRDP